MAEACQFVEPGLRQLTGEQVEQQPVMPGAIPTALVPPHDPNRAEPDPAVGADGALVRRCRVDREAMVPADLEEVARQRADGVAAEALALVRRVEKQVDAGVAVVRATLLGILDAPDEDAIERDREGGAVVRGE